MLSMPELLTTVRRHRQAIFALVMIVTVVLILWLARGALPAFLIGLALAFVLDPVVSWLARAGAPRWAGVLIAYLAVVLVIWAIVAYVVPPISRQTAEFIDHLPELGAAIGNVEQALRGLVREPPDAGRAARDDRGPDRRRGRRSATW